MFASLTALFLLRQFLYRMGSAYRLHRRTCYTKKEPPRRILEVLFVYISLRCFVCMSATAMIQLGNRCATVVAKWSRSLQRTCSSPQKAHRCPSDVLWWSRNWQGTCSLNYGHQYTRRVQMWINGKSNKRQLKPTNGWHEKHVRKTTNAISSRYTIPNAISTPHERWWRRLS